MNSDKSLKILRTLEIKIKDWTNIDVDIPDDFVINIFHTLLIISLMVLSKKLFTKYLYKRFTSTDARESVKQLTPKTINFITIGILLKIWFLGQSGLATLLAISSNYMDKIVSTVYIFMFYAVFKEAIAALVPLKKSYDIKKQYLILKYSNITLGFITGLFFIKLWFAGEANLSTYFGLLSAGLAIALQDIITSLAGWFYLLIVKPFSVGERIRIGEISGDVVDIQAFQFSIQELASTPGAEQPTGRIVHIPNREIFKMPIANFNAGFDFVWHEIPVLITFESNWHKAKDILQDILEEKVGLHNEEAKKQINHASKNMQMSFGHLDSRLWVNVLDSGVLISMRYLIDPKKVRPKSSEIWSEILNQFAMHEDIDFAYPTQRVYYNGFEGKAQARNTFPLQGQGISIHPQ